MDNPLEKTKTISCLFPEILTMIFNYLEVKDIGRAAQVSTGWRDAAYNRRVWRGVEARLHLRKENITLFRSLIRRGIKHIQILSFRRKLSDLIFGIPNIESLNMSGCYSVTDMSLEGALTQELPSLTLLNLSLCKQITDSTLGRIASYLKNLETLDISGCSLVTNNGILLIACGLKKLRYLNLRSCRNISDQGVEHLAGISNISIQGTQELEKLVLQDCQKLTDLSLSYIASGLPKLKTLNLSFCSSITDSGLRFIAKMRDLQELNLRVCDNITDMGISYLATGGSHISCLDISFSERISDQALLHIAHGIFNIRRLDIRSCAVSDEGICHLVKMQNLRSLSIGQCMRVTDNSLKLIGEHLTNLEYIDLYGCPKITTAGLEKLVQLPKLISLNLRLSNHNSANTSNVTKFI